MLGKACAVRRIGLEWARGSDIIFAFEENSMNPQSKRILHAALALCFGLGCQIANGLADKPTAVPTSAQAVHTAVVAATAPIATPTTPAVPAASTPTPPTAATTSPTSLTVAPTASPVPPSCPNPNAAITSPGMNAAVAGIVEIRGTATQSDMQYWKVEFRPETSTTYSSLNNTTTVVTDGVLARWSTRTVSNGVYFVRLVIVQKDGNFPTPCEIRITIAN
jgi:hypothetical protein